MKQRFLTLEEALPLAGNALAFAPASLKVGARQADISILFDPQPKPTVL